MDKTPSIEDLECGLVDKLSKVTLFLCDVDGVLTDASVLVGNNRESEYKRFSIQDGLGLVLLKNAGIRVGWVSARFSPATRLRAEELGIDFLVQGKEGKLESVQRLASDQNMAMENILFVGDDLVDYRVMKSAGVAVAVANARKDILNIADYITRSPGGSGAIREISELVLKATGLWDNVTETYFKG